MKFSILVPCFNLAPWVRICLDSVRAQTYGDWECVVVDDGSTDASAEILDVFAASDGRFRILHQAHAGVGEARNTALLAARGEWLLFLDGDDVVAPTTLEHVSKAIEVSPDAQAVRFEYERFRDSWSASSAVRAPRPVVVDIVQGVPVKALRSYLWQYAFRRETAAGLRFARYRRGEDRVFVVEALLKRVTQYVEMNETLYGYRLREGSAMRSAAERQGMLDELGHRLDVVRLVSSSTRKVDFTDPEWIEWIEDFYLNHWRQLKQVKEEWLAQLRALERFPGISQWGRLRIWIATRCPLLLCLVSQMGRRHG